MKDPKGLRKQVAKTRRLLQDPYAYDDGSGKCDAYYVISHDDMSLRERLVESRRLLQNPHAYDDGTGNFDAYFALPKEDRLPNTSQYLKSDYKSPISEDTIKHLARNLQKDIWYRRDDLWPEGVPNDRVDMLDPTIAIKLIGFDYDLADSLGEFRVEGKNIEVAGLIDRGAHRVSISRNLPHITHRFTAAHELGHAIMHKEARLHRDRPMDGSSQDKTKRNVIEKEADKFAAYFLMPEKLVRGRFEKIFGVSNAFVLNDDTAFALNPGKPDELLSRCRNLRDLTRILAKTEYYNGRHVNSLAAQFHVSPEAMAIRLEELGLALI